MFIHAHTYIYTYTHYILCIKKRGHDFERESGRRHRGGSGENDVSKGNSKRKLDTLLLIPSYSTLESPNSTRSYQVNGS